MTATRIVAISDFCTVSPPEPASQEAYLDFGLPPRALAAGTAVRGGYLERLPLAAVRAGWVSCAEVWSFAGSDADPVGLTLSSDGPDLRRFRADGHIAPYGSRAMLAHLRRFGAPEILCVWGLGVTREILDHCADSIRIYNSLDVDALRVPAGLSAQFDIVLCGSPAQQAEVLQRHPGMLTAILPVGPEFASAETFRPLDLQKSVDVIYVAAAQAYKRHDILFDALAQLPRHIRALCVMGYGEDAGHLHDDARSRGLNIDFVGPPGVSHNEVNRLMNTARIGVVCGVNDGAPAILTEYMLAGLPVLANDALCCGLQYITPQTGMAAPAHHFADAIASLLATRDQFAPRQVVMDNWTWDHSILRLRDLISEARARRAFQTQRRRKSS